MAKRQFAPGRGYTKKDWDAVSDSPDITREMMRKARSFEDAFPDLAAGAKRQRGPQKAPTKVAVSIRLSRDVVEHFKAGGPGWQARIDEALQKIVR